MKNEADFKRIFKNSIKASKGFSLSLAAPMLAGLPDLFCALPGYVPILLEAKWLGEINSIVFDRKIPFSALQLHWMAECNRVNPYTAFGLTGLKRNGSIYAIITPSDVTRMDYKFEDKFAYAVYSKSKKVFEINDLFTKADVPKINTEIHTVSQNNLIHMTHMPNDKSPEALHTS